MMLICLEAMTSDLWVIAVLRKLVVCSAEFRVVLRELMTDL
jgi:hypothetical protein